MYDKLGDFICEAIEKRPWLSNAIDRVLESAASKDETWALKMEYRSPNGRLPTDAELPARIAECQTGSLEYISTAQIEYRLNNW